MQSESKDLVKIRVISGLHYITQEVLNFSHDELAEQACLGGVDWVQLRVKNKPYEECLAIAQKTKVICKTYGARLIINDDVKLAKEIGADGVHLGKADMSPVEARTILSNDFIIGGTANTIEDIERLVAAKVDYIGLGPFRFTTTKENLSPIIGIEGYEKIMKQCQEKGISIPIIAIGGIKTVDIKTIMQTGVYGIAVSSLINLSEQKTETIQSIRHELHEFSLSGVRGIRVN
jgi:thiamine-phosphate pyrophosphorylase